MGCMARWMSIWVKKRLQPHPGCGKETSSSCLLWVSYLEAWQSDETWMKAASGFKGANAGKEWSLRLMKYVDVDLCKTCAMVRLGNCRDCVSSQSINLFKVSFCYSHWLFLFPTHSNLFSSFLLATNNDLTPTIINVVWVSWCVFLESDQPQNPVSKMHAPLGKVKSLCCIGCPPYMHMLHYTDFTSACFLSGSPKARGASGKEVHPKWYIFNYSGGVQSGKQAHFGAVLWAILQVELANPKLLCTLPELKIPPLELKVDSDQSVCMPQKPTCYPEWKRQWYLSVQHLQS